MFGVITRKLEVLPMPWRLLPGACALLLAGGCTHGALRSVPSEAEKATPTASRGWSAASEASPNEGRPFSLIHVAAGTQHCDQLQIACFQRCWERYPPYPVERGNKGQYRYCTSQCLEEYRECVRDAEAQPREFPNKSVALDWLKASDRDPGGHADFRWRRGVHHRYKWRGCIDFDSSCGSLRRIDDSATRRL